MSLKICTFDGCGRAFKARGLCAAHHLQKLKGKPLTPIKPWKGPRGRTTGPGTYCTVEGCEKPINSGGLCSMHYWRWQTHGDTSACTTNRYLSMVDRFWMKVEKGPGCWEWVGGSRDGYGTFTERSKGKTHLAHRLAYELVIGQIPDGKLIDHRCRNTLCVNPKHLRPVTHKQNMEHQDGAHRNSTTGARGVHLNKKDGHYYASVGHNRKTVSGGRFKTLEEAAEAAKALRLSLFTHNDLDRATS